MRKSGRSKQLSLFTFDNQGELAQCMKQVYNLDRTVAFLLYNQELDTILANTNTNKIK